MRKSRPAPYRLRRRHNSPLRLMMLVLLGAASLPSSALAAMTPEPTSPPGPSSPAPGTAPNLNRAPPEIIKPNGDQSGVITPPAGISRMPVIKPKVPTRTPVIPPAGSPGGATNVIPK